MKRKNENKLMLITGILVGASAAYFLNSKKGKEIIDQLLEKSSDLKSSLSEQTSLLGKEGAALVDNAIDTSNGIVLEAKDKVIAVGDNIKANVDNSMNDFQKGIQKAKEKLRKLED